MSRQQQEQDADARARQAFVSATGVSRETLDDLDVYEKLLRQWQNAINLVGPSTLSELWTRHMLDSWQLLAAAPNAKTWVDLGSGGGFPGIVLAIAAKERARGHVTLVESNGKKTAFLQTVVRLTHSPATVIRGRIEDVVPTLAPPDVITARALAPLAQLLRWCEPLLKTGTICLFPKGRDLDKELREAAIYWDMDFSVIPSVVDRESSIIKISSISLRPPAQPRTTQAQ